jgi:MraZ protein
MFTHTIDSKGRVSVPTKFREILRAKYDDRLIVTNYLDPCLVAYPFEEWKRIEEKFAAQSSFKKEIRAFKRLLISAATECTIDRQGRILIPPGLREHARLDKEAVLVGQITYFEIWDRLGWDKEMGELQHNPESIGNALAEFGL